MFNRQADGFTMEVEVIVLVSKIHQLFHEELEQLAQIRSICNDQRYKDNELLEHYANMVTSFERNLRSMMKMTKISDSQQLYLQEIQRELEREIEERIKAEEKVADAYNRHRRNQFLLDLAEGNRTLDERAWNTARQLKLYLPTRVHAFYIQFTTLQGIPFNQVAGGSVKVQATVDTMVDKLNTLPGVVAWEWGEGIGLLHAASQNETRERQVCTGLGLKKQLAGSFLQLEIAMGVAGQQGEIHQFAHLCNQARAAANLGCRLWPGQDVYHYHDGQAFQLLYPLADRQDAAEFIERMIGKLLIYDRENNTDLLATLKKILESPNLKVVAEEMFLHHKTIVSRKQRIESILDISLELFEVKFNIAIALHLLKIRG